MIVANYLAAGALFCLGVFVITTQRSLLKIVMGLSLMESSCYLLIVSLGYRKHSTAPVLVQPPPGTSTQRIAKGRAADPVLQNFCLIAIVIGVAVTAVFLTVAVRVVQHQRSVDAEDMRALRG
ncbi:MAG TPA: sodium:proton antiporter [Jatrophihabitans sp.]|nr:sodium:proton antiporter [Jatrophihabitans sp.]